MSQLTNYPLLVPPPDVQLTSEESTYNHLYEILYKSGITTKLIALGVAQDKAGLNSYAVWKELFTLQELTRAITKYATIVEQVVTGCDHENTTKVNADLLALYNKYDIACMKNTIFCRFVVVQIMDNLIALAENRMEFEGLADETGELFLFEDLSECSYYLTK